MILNYLRQTIASIIINYFTFLSVFLVCLLVLLLLLLLLLIRVFHISVSWCSFTGDWETASLLKSPRLFSVFWPFSIMLLFGWSPFGRHLPNLPGSLVNLYLPCQKHQSQLVLFSPWCSIVFFFRFSRRVAVLISLFTFFQFYSVVSRDSKVHNLANFLFFWLIIIRSGLLAEIMWSVCISKSHRSLCLSFSSTGAGLCIYHLLAWSNLNFLHISQWITLPTQSCLALNSFYANLLHSLIMWLMVSSLSPHSLYLLFCCVLSILALIWLVLIVLFVLPLGEILFFS